MLLGEVKNQWKQWVNQVPVIGFNSGKYDIDMVKKYDMVKKCFLKELSHSKESQSNKDVFVAKNENEYIFLITTKFKFLNVKNYIGPGLSYDALCKSVGCRRQKLMFPSEWLDSYEN